MVSMYRIPTTETAIIADLKNPPGKSGSNARRRSNNQEQRSPPMALPPPMFPNTNLSQFQLSKVRVPVITPSKRAGNENKHMLGSEAKNHVSTSKSASRESKKNNEDGSDAEEINPRDQNHFVESNFQLQDPSQQQHFDWNQKEKAQSQTEDQNSNPMINFESQNAVAYEDPYKILQSIENMESLDSVEEYLVDGIGNGDPNSTFRLDESVQLRTSMIDSSSPPTKDLLSHGNSMLTTVPALRISEVNVHSPEHCFLDPNVTESNAVNHSSTLTVTPASFHQSPSPKQLDWHCPNMDQFFRDSLTGSVGSFASDNESNHDEVESNRDSPERIVAFRQSHSRRSSLSCNLPEEPKPSLPKQVEETSETSNKSKSGHSSSPAPPLRPISLVPRNRVQDSLQVDSIFCSSKTSGNVSRNDYDDDLLSKIRMTKPPTMSLPPCLFPNKSEGTQRVLIRGGTVKSSNGCFNDASDTEMINNGTMKSTSSYHEFLMDLFPAFEGCTFLLPSLKKRKNQLRSNNSQCKIKISSFGNIKLNSRLSEVKPVGPTSGELAIGKRRVETAICAFGGSIKRKTAPKRVQHSSIFRKKEPISDSAESEEKQNSRKRKKYEEKQKQQYFENGSRLSWEVTYTFDDDDGPMKKRTPSGLTVFSSPTRRKKYRCKLCGQLKQNHTCPFEESLLRSIGVMVYPSINPHVADEPGSLAPPLSEMNNFALVGSASFAESSPVSSAGKTMETKADIIKVSPPQRRKECQDSRDTVNGSTTKDVVTAEKNEEVGIKSIFQPAMEIAPEQYRLVTPLREWEISSETGSYSYPAVPLTHAQRKSASVKLFGISKKLPSLTQECAEVLKEAREGNQWDLAVAELTTQVICVTRCSESKDYKLEGLRRYLLTLGIAC